MLDGGPNAYAAENAPVTWAKTCEAMQRIHNHEPGEPYGVKTPAGQYILHCQQALTARKKEITLDQSARHRKGQGLFPFNLGI